MNTNEINFAYKIRHALNEHLDNLSTPTADRLASARKIALSRKKKDLPGRVLVRSHVLAGGAASFFEKPLSWLGRIGVAAPLLFGAILVVGMYQSAEQQRISDLADIDAAVLSDELPLSAYVDHGFSAYLAKRAE
jgi:protein-S-isoprenylcysteine O-methyltransferase Ste14